MWEREASLGDHIQETWKGERTWGDLGTISRALKNTLISMKNWSAQHFGSVRKELDKLRAQLADLQATDADGNTIKEII
jgi:hypothetical protein